MNEYEKYEADCNKVQKANKKLLKEFADFLRAANLSEKTIKNHIFNVELYINDYLLYEWIILPKEGISSVDMFLGYWFIKKASWASQAYIKSNAASLTKFYTFLLKKGLITEDELKELKSIIKSNMPEWLATMARYDDPSIDDMDEVWG